MADEDMLRALDARVDYLTATIKNLLDELGPEEDEDRYVFGLLGGCIGLDKLNRPVVRYLIGDEERVARRVLVQLLRSDRPLSRELRDLLAALFDPDRGHPPIGRRLVFTKRRGRSAEFHRDLIIHLLMVMQVGAGFAVDSALDRVGRIYGMTSDAVRKVWEKSQQRESL
jgi:hypothetical protein